MNFSLIPVLNFEELCQQVFALHDDIRYAGIIDDFGSLIAGGMRKGIDSITPQDNDELYLVQTALRKSMRQRFDNSMGRARFAYVEREKISMLTFYMEKYTLLLSIEPNVDSHSVIDITKDVQDLITTNYKGKSGTDRLYRKLYAEQIGGVILY